jgi:asparagine synthase (glutamine-hydrolysing)
LRTSDQLESWLWRHLRGHLLVALDRPLFRPQYQRALDDLARQSLREALAPYAHIDPIPRRIWRLFLSQRLRRETSLSMVKFGSAVEPRLPYLDNDLVDYLLTLPPERMLDDSLQSHILRKRRPAFLDIVNANTGTRLGAGRLATSISRIRTRIFAKLGLPGYQPYERLGLWLRQELAPLVKDVLLAPETADRGIFDPDTVRIVIEDHLARRKNHTFLLMAMMIFELGARHLNTEPQRKSNPVQPLASIA